MKTFPISMLRGGALTLTLMLLAAPLAKAGKHPVPLEKNTESAKCIECHAEKTKGKAVHSAIAMGCTTCHEIRPAKDVTRIKLTTTTTQALCLGCHADKKAADIKGKVHPPAVRDCVKCHDPHASENKNQLLKPATGDAKENLCLSCHKIGTDLPKGGSRHAALDMGCDSCHVTHKTSDKGDAQARYHLAKNAPALCLDCHEVKDPSLAAAHQNQPFEATDCLTCHDPHQSREPKLMAAFVHAPFAAGKSSCETCHQPAQNGKVVLTTASAKDLCLTCHADKGEQIAKAKVQHPGAAGDCTDCHNPHAGQSPGFLRPDPVKACTSCHTDQAEAQKKSVLHQPAFEQGCATCHEPHGGDNPQLLRAKSANQLCLECHGPNSKPVKLEGEHLVAIFDSRVKLPEDYFNSVSQLALKYGLGHPVQGHPTGDLVNPRDPSKVSVRLNCLSCHQPHAGSQRGLLVKDQPNNKAFCDSCHKTEDFLK